MSRPPLQSLDGATTSRPSGSSIGTGTRRSQIPVFNASNMAQHMSRRESILADGALNTPAHPSTSQRPRRTASHDASTLLSTTRRDPGDPICSTVAPKPAQSRLGTSRVSNVGANAGAPSGPGAMPFFQTATRVSKIHAPVTPTRLSEQVPQPLIQLFFGYFSCFFSLFSFIYYFS